MKTLTIKQLESLGIVNNYKHHPLCIQRNTMMEQYKNKFKNK